MCLWSAVCQLCWSWLDCLIYLQLIWDDLCLFHFVFFLLSWDLFIWQRQGTQSMNRNRFPEVCLEVPPRCFCCIYWLVQVLEPARVKGCRIKLHMLERWVAMSHCMAQASCQGWTQGGVEHDSHFYNLWSLWFETICHLLCAYNWPECILMAMPNLKWG